MSFHGFGVSIVWCKSNKESEIEETRLFFLLMTMVLNFLVKFKLEISLFPYFYLFYFLMYIFKKQEENERLLYIWLQ